jgi:hypothetical protein
MTESIAIHAKTQKIGAKVNVSHQNAK